MKHIKLSIGHSRGIKMKKNVNFAKKLFINISILLLLQILVLGIKNSYCTGLYWQVASPNGNRFMTTPAVATIGSDTVVYSAVAKEFWGSSDCVLYAFTDAGSSASLRWSYNLSVNITYGNGAHISNIIVDNGVLYIGPRLYKQQRKYHSNKCRYRSQNMGTNSK